MVFIAEYYKEEDGSKRIERIEVDEHGALVCWMTALSTAYSSTGNGEFLEKLELN